MNGNYKMNNTDSGQVLVEVRELSRRFGKTLALDGVSMRLERGQILGLVGANGSGKSTLMRHFIGLYPAQQGECRTFGKDAKDLAAADMARIGYVHQEGELLEWMTVRQLVRYVSAYYPGWDHGLQEDYIRQFEIDVKARVASLSPGERQKVAILLAVGFGPELLILDEPAAALDPVARADFLNLLLEFIQEQQRAAVISSHILSDVEKVIDHVIIMKKGRFLRDVGFDELREEFCRVRLSSLNGSLADDLGFEGVCDVKREQRQAVLVLQGADWDAVRVRARELRCEVDIQRLGLEDIYRVLVNKEGW